MVVRDGRNAHGRVLNNKKYKNIDFSILEIDISKQRVGVARGTPGTVRDFFVYFGTI